MTREERRSYRTSEGFVDRLDAWLGPDAPIWPFINQVLMPWLGWTSYVMCALMFVAALLHDDLLFAALLLTIALVMRRLQSDALEP